MKKPLLLLFSSFLLFNSVNSQINVDAGPKNEVFRKTDLRVAATRMWDPWEIIYGPDDSLWITEAKGYRVSKVSPVNGGLRMILDISQGSTFLPLAERPFNRQFNIGTNNPQGGLMGMAIHPDFNHPTSPKRYVYIAYVHTFVQTLPGNAGSIYQNRIVRFTYSMTTHTLGSPVSICDTLPGSNDHNSGRLIIAPVGDSMYLFYAAGDMGAGQFSNQWRANKAQEIGPYEGKILRFRLEPDNDADTYQRWIPSSGTGIYRNPYNGVVHPQSAVWAIGVRNNQGFVYANGKLFGSSHGPFTDDEVNIFEAGMNYGHPRVIGFKDDRNYDDAKASLAASSLPLIYNEKKFAEDTIGATYRDPVLTFYPAPKGANGTPNTVQHIYINNPGNIGWPSEGISGIDFYTKSMIPGWKNSLMINCMKFGRIIRMNMDPVADTTLPSGTLADTNTLFRSVNRFRDLAISPDGRSIFTAIDSSSTTSGPTTTDPIISACRGCIQKYTFLGYNANGTTPFASNIPGSIAIAAGVPGQCDTANYVVINAANNNTNIWVPITDRNSNIVAEIYAAGNNLDTVRTTFYKNSGGVREDGGRRLYLDRNITITPQTQPGSNVRIRLYITNAEFNALSSAVNSLAQPSGVATISNLGIFKNNNNTCGATLTGGSAAPLSTSPGLKVAHASGGYVLQSNSLSSFSSFFFGNVANATLPVEMVAFTGRLERNATKLNWTTSSEVNTAKFDVERSIDGTNFEQIGTVAASGNSTRDVNYAYTDNNVSALSAPVIYYRLKINDIDGNYSYSNVVTVSLADIVGRVTVMPNPVADEAKITIAAFNDGQAQWQILDNSGRVVMQNSVKLKKGTNNVVVNVNKLAAGLYFLNVKGGGIDQKVKLQKL